MWEVTFVHTQQPIDRSRLLLTRVFKSDNELQEYASSRPECSNSCEAKQHQHTDKPDNIAICKRIQPDVGQVGTRAAPSGKAASPANSHGIPSRQLRGDLSSRCPRGERTYADMIWLWQAAVQRVRMPGCRVTTSRCTHRCLGPRRDLLNGDGGAMGGVLLVKVLPCACSGDVNLSCRRASNRPSQLRRGQAVQ